MTRDDLLGTAASVAAEDLPALLGMLVEAEETVRLRLRAVQSAQTVPVATEPDMNLPAAEAARRLAVSKDWLYRQAHRLPFVVRIGRRVLFSARGLERWNRSRMGRTA